MKQSKFTPTTFEELERFSEAMARSGVIPRVYKGKPADIMAAVITGEELGMPPMASLRSIDMIQGNPTLAADLIVALALSHPNCEYFTLQESTDKVATYTTKREGSEPVTLSFTAEQAATAKLRGKDNWKQYPDAMLRSRCSAALGRIVYPDILTRIYTPDELGDETDRGQGVQVEDGPTDKLENFGEGGEPDIETISREQIAKFGEDAKTAGMTRGEAAVLIKEVLGGVNWDEAPATDLPKLNAALDAWLQDKEQDEEPPPEDPEQNDGEPDLGF